MVLSEAVSTILYYQTLWKSSETPPPSPTEELSRDQDRFLKTSRASVCGIVSCRCRSDLLDEGSDSVQRHSGRMKKSLRCHLLFPILFFSTFGSSVFQESSRCFGVPCFLRADPSRCVDGLPRGADGGGVLGVVGRGDVRNNERQRQEAQAVVRWLPDEGHKEKLEAQRKKIG